MKLRSLLFVPGNRERFLAKLEALRPDAAILDLEDSIPPSEKVTGRECVREVLLSGRFGDRPLFVRVNDLRSDLAAADIAAVVTPRLAGVFLPKVEHPDELREANRLLATAEARAGLEVGSTRVIPIVETVRGILQLAELAQSGRR